MTIYNCTKGTNSNYHIHLSCPGHKFEIICDMPEQITLAVGSDWESRLPYSLTEMLNTIGLGAVGGALEAVFNARPIYQELSYQMWMGTSPIEIPLTLQFNAETDPIMQVHRPIKQLLAAALPNNRAGPLGTVLSPPGPRKGGSDGDYGVTIRIGKIVSFINCIIVQAQETFDTQLHSSGYPISGQVELTLRTGMVYGAVDWMAAAGYGEMP